MSGCNEGNCPCTNTSCEMHGKCCECINLHRKINALPTCMQQIIENNK